MYKVSAQRLKLEASEEENARLKARVRGLEIQVPHRKLKAHRKFITQLSYNASWLFLSKAAAS
jgi:hypothetical protein